MGELLLNNTMSAMANKTKLMDGDVLQLRQTVFADGVVQRREAEALFALDRAVADKSDSWVSFFVEAVTDYLVDVEAPKGYISKDNAQWLIRTISSDGVVDSLTELEVLLRAMDKAKSMPPSLSAFALSQVKHAVLEGEGPLAKGRSCVKGVVTAADVAMLRRVLYSYSGDGALSISRDEAEVLFDINDATFDADNDPSWSDLFSKAIAFSLMAAGGHVAESREKALAREEWLADDSVNVGGFFSKMFANGLNGMRDALAAPNSLEAVYRARNETFERDNRIAERIDAEEAAWLINRIGRDGKFHENELALIAFLKAESHHLHPSLKPLLDKVA
ncbi:hypothetical protein WNY59_07490 [Ahrensia kielensis]|uniref:DUF4375 domain-containing protein n=1 Tax=Ahrensia kielensis TaxID=76980 RepID=A0ABU9T5N1_9HYPH